MSPTAIDLTFPAARRTCRLRLGAGAIDALIEELSGDPPARLFVIVSDDRVAPLHAGPLAERMRGRGLRTEVLTFPAGESSKTRETKAGLEDRLVALGAGRDTALVAVGGGVTGDLAGFVASTWHRGIPVIQVPTSLLAMADAAVGGKTAVNLVAGKNLVGTWHQPWGVYADVSVLSTLSRRDYTDGFAEVVKAAAIADARLFRTLEETVEELKRRDPEALERTVTRCVEIKARVVRRDEREAGRRAILNFGHTVGHAIEAAGDFEIRHGPAVAVGMVVESRLAEDATGFPAAHGRRLRRLLGSLGLPVDVPAGLSADAIVRATQRDKKVRDCRVRYALPVRLGRMRPGGDVTVAVPESRLRAVLQASMAAAGD